VNVFTTIALFIGLLILAFALSWSALWPWLQYFDPATPKHRRKSAGRAEEMPAAIADASTPVTPDGREVTVLDGRVRGRRGSLQPRQNTRARRVG
jgi:hypothetical protein